MSESSTRSLAIILRRKPAGDDSLYIDTILESGQFQGLKIPGVLKSSKRSSFHFSPGAVYEVIFRAQGDQSVIPRNTELVFSPFSDSQDYARLSAVAEIVQTADFMKSAPDNAELFTLMRSVLENLPSEKDALEIHLDGYYWKFLDFLGLAAVADSGVEEPVAYDLVSGPVTAREMAERAHTDFVLPFAWVKRAQGDGTGVCDSKACRELIRKYLSAL